VYLTIDAHPSGCFCRIHGLIGYAGWNVAIDSFKAQQEWRRTGAGQAKAHGQALPCSHSLVPPMSRECALHVQRREDESAGLPCWMAVSGGTG
jgi:hypothetical protein